MGLWGRDTFSGCSQHLALRLRHSTRIELLTQILLRRFQTCYNISMLNLEFNGDQQWPVPLPQMLCPKIKEMWWTVWWNTVDSNFTSRVHRYETTFQTSSDCKARKLHLMVKGDIPEAVQFSADVDYHDDMQKQKSLKSYLLHTHIDCIGIIYRSCSLFTSSTY